MKAYRAKVKEFFLRDIQPVKPEELATSDQYECRRCHKRMTSLYPLQTRSGGAFLANFELIY